MAFDCTSQVPAWRKSIQKCILYFLTKTVILSIHTLGLDDSSVIPKMPHHISLIKHTNSASEVQKVGRNQLSVLYHFNFNIATNPYTSKALRFQFGMAEHAHCTHLKSSRAEQMPALPVLLQREEKSSMSLRSLNRGGSVRKGGTINQ